MIYTIKYAGKVIASSLGDGTQNIYDGKLSLKANNAGSLSFNLPYGHVSYDSVSGNDIVSVERDGEEIFFGHITNEKIDRYRSKTVTCEGLIALCSDIAIDSESGTTLTMSGICNILTDGTNYTWDTNSSTALAVNGNSVKDMLSNHIKNNGGYFVTKRNGETVMLDYITSNSSVAMQEIHSSDNLSDITIEKNFITQTQSLNVTAIDKAIVDNSVKPFNLLDSVHVVSVPHGLDTNLTVTQIQINISNPADTKIILGTSQKSLTQNIANGG